MFITLFNFLFIIIRFGVNSIFFRHCRMQQICIEIQILVFQRGYCLQYSLCVFFACVYLSLYYQCFMQKLVTINTYPNHNLLHYTTNQFHSHKCPTNSQAPSSKFVPFLYYRSRICRRYMSISIPSVSPDVSIRNLYPNI